MGTVPYSLGRAHGYHRFSDLRFVPMSACGPDCELHPSTPAELRVWRRFAVDMQFERDDRTGAHAMPRTVVEAVGNSRAGINQDALTKARRFFMDGEYIAVDPDYEARAVGEFPESEPESVRGSDKRWYASVTVKQVEAPETDRQRAERQAYVEAFFAEMERRTEDLERLRHDAWSHVPAAYVMVRRGDLAFALDEMRGGVNRHPEYVRLAHALRDLP